MPSQNVIAYAKLHNLSTDWNEWSPGEFQDFFNWKNDTGMDNMVEMSSFGTPSESTISSVRTIGRHDRFA